MAKKFYAKPFMVKEQFTSNEYIATCWYLDEGDCYNNLYYDNTSSVINTWGTHNSSSENRAVNHGSHRVPAEGSTNYPYFNTKKGQNLVSAPRDFKYYTSYSSYYVYNPYSGEISSNTPIYYITVDDVTHYFSTYQTNGNHS